MDYSGPLIPKTAQKGSEKASKVDGTPVVTSHQQDLMPFTMTLLDWPPRQNLPSEQCICTENAVGNGIKWFAKTSSNETNRNKV